MCSGMSALKYYQRDKTFCGLGVEIYLDVKIGLSTYIAQDTIYSLVILAHI